MSDLPQGWAIAVLADLIAREGVFSDGDWVESKDQDPNGSIRLLQLADIGDGVFLGKSNRFINEQKFEQLRCTEVLEGDVLVARMPDPLGRACLAPQLRQRCITVVDVAIVRPGQESVHPIWLMHFLNAPEVRQEIEVQSSGTTRRRISRSNLAQLQLPVTPLNEQKRIADKIDTVLARVDACRKRLDRVPAILKRFRQAVLAAATSGKLTEEWRVTQGVGLDTHTFEFADAEAFRDYVFPQSWGRARLSDIASVVGGVTKDANKQLSEYVEVPYMRVANVQRGFFDLTEIKTIRVPQERLAELLLEPDDILFNEGGDIDKLGRGWVWGSEIEPCIFQNHVFRARLNDRRFSPRFFSWYGNSRGYDYFLSRGKQTTNLASINKSVLSALPVPLPPAEEQDEIVRRVEALFAYADRLEARYTIAHDQIDRLTPALLAKAFRGELVPQDPNDEPASVLLERIRAARAATEGAAGPKRRKGRGRPRTPQKTEVLMLTRNDIQDTHLTMILKEHGPLTAEALWSASQLDIDDFYDQLKDEEARGLLQEKRGDSSNTPRMLEAA